MLERTHGRKRFHHPLVRELALVFEAVTLPGDAEQTLFVYSAEAGSASHERLVLLASWAADPSRQERRSPRTGVTSHGRSGQAGSATSSETGSEAGSGAGGE